MKLATTSVLLMCFVVLQGPRTVHALFAIRSESASVSSSTAPSLIRHMVLEIASGAEDLESPQKSEDTLGDFVSKDNFVFAAPRAPIREHVFLPLGSFWSGRILRRIVSDEPDGH
jgi:hypothetical protein